MSSSRLPDFFEEARGQEWLGFQVTSPHKRAAMRFVDEIEPAAVSIGAINSGIRSDAGRLVGFNTDSPGFARSVRNDLGIDLSGKVVVIAGAGGAARAIVHACLEAGVASLHVGNRDRERAGHIGDESSDTRLVTGGLGRDFEDALHEADLAVNATTVGMTSPGMPFDVRLLPDDASVFDLVYAPPSTALVLAARGRGLSAVNGIGMLVAQAAIAFERWTGVADADQVMRDALLALDEESASLV